MPEYSEADSFSKKALFKLKQCALYFIGGGGMHKSSPDVACSIYHTRWLLSDVYDVCAKCYEWHYDTKIFGVGRVVGFKRLR